MDLHHRIAVLQTAGYHGLFGEVDSNHRPQGYEPCEPPTALSPDESPRRELNPYRQILNLVLYPSRNGEPNPSRNCLSYRSKNPGGGKGGEETTAGVEWATPTIIPTG